MLLLEQFYNLTLNPANAARLKELVLQLAVQGKLTEAWRKENPDVEPASELLKRIEAEKEELVKGKKIKKEKFLEPMSVDEVPYAVPENWIWCKLGELGYTNIGLTYSPKDISDVGIPVLRSSNIQNGKIDLNDLVRVDRKVDKSNLVKVGDLLICARNGSKKLVGKCALIEELKEETAFGAFMAIFRSEYNNYIKYFIESPIYRQSLEGVTTTTINQITQGNLKNTFLPLPPLAEQEAIVARVEELFKNIEALQEKTAQRIELKKQLGTAALQNLTTATPEDLPQNWQFLKGNFGTIFSEAANVKKLRESILQLAIQGKLTQAWRHQNPNPEPASELLKRIQAEKAQLIKEKKIKKEKALPNLVSNELFFEIPQNWEWCRLGDIGFITGGGTPDKGKISYWNGEIPWVSPKDMWFDFITDSEDKITVEGLKNSSTNLIPVDSLLIVGRSGILKRKLPVAINKVECTVNQDIKVVIPYLTKMSMYIKISLNGLEGIILKDFIKYGMTVHSLKYDEFKQIPIPIPPLAEQQAIIAKADELLQLCDELEKQIEQSKQETEALMQAVVQEALQVKEEVVI